MKRLMMLMLLPTLVSAQGYEPTYKEIKEYCVSKEILSTNELIRARIAHLY